MPERRQRLRKTLDTLHRELEASEELAPPLREELRRAAREIEARLAEPGAEASDEGAGGVGDRAQALAVRFEGSHPKLAEVLHRLALGLAELGI